MIDREMINNAYNDAMKESKDEYEKNVALKIGEYIESCDYFSIEGICKVFSYEKYSNSYIRDVIERNLKDYYTGIKELPSEKIIVKYQNKFIQSLFNNFDFEYRLPLFDEYVNPYNFATNDVFSQKEILKYEECLKDKEKIEKKLNTILVKTASELNKTCVVTLKDLIPSKYKTTGDWMIILIYNYIIRNIFEESKILFETISSEHDVKEEESRLREFQYYRSSRNYESDEGFKKKSIRYSRYGYELRGFI